MDRCVFALQIGRGRGLEVSFEGSGEVGHIFKAAGSGGFRNRASFFKQALSFCAAQQQDCVKNRSAHDLFKPAQKGVDAESGVPGNLIQCHRLRKMLPNVGDGGFQRVVSFQVAIALAEKIIFAKCAEKTQ